ncbi:MAG: hypothetical protein AAF926_08240, partial [Pseudomonadota bacterium]
IDKSLEEKALGEIEYLRLRVIEEVDRIESRSRSVFQRASELPTLIKSFQKENKPVESFLGVGKFRFLLFDVIMPVSLYFLATLVHFSPDVSAVLLDLSQSSMVE